MNRTNKVRELVQSKLSNSSFASKYDIKRVSYENADNEEMYPHIVYGFDTINLGDLNRKDLMLVVDIYDKSDSADRIENIADEIEDMFNCQNLPQDSILPTFFLENRRIVKDEDKKIKHKQIEILIQNYER